MTDRKARNRKPKIEKLELHKETVQDLTDIEQEEAKGGLNVPRHSVIDSCYATDCCLATVQDPTLCVQRG